MNNANIYKLQLLKLLHILISVAVFFVFWLIFRYYPLSEINLSRFRYNLFVTGAYGVMLYWFHRTYNAYLLGYSRIRSLVFGQLSAQLFSLLIVYIGVSIAWVNLRNPLPFLPMLAIQLVIDVVWSWAATQYYFRITPIKRTILVYRNEVDLHRFGSLAGKPAGQLYRIERKVQFDGAFEDLKEQLKPYDAVFLTGINSHCRNEVLKYCKQRGVPVFVLPHVGDLLMRGGMHIKTFDTPVLYIQRKSLFPGYALMKRCFDILFSVTILLVMSPFMLITAIAIRLCDHGPVFYRQTRLTKGGKEFQILKFRSMHVDAEKDGIPRLSSGEQDERITPVGRFLRKHRLDELPQLFNILKGDMSVVGPRPERPEIAEVYYKTMPEFSLRLQVKAGLTGYAQVYGRYNTEPHEKLEFDLLYIEQMNLLNDIKLCFATFSILFSADSAQGVEDGRIAPMDTTQAAGEEEPVSDHKVLPVG